MHIFYKLSSRFILLAVCLSFFAFKNEKQTAATQKKPFAEKETKRSGSLKHTPALRAAREEMRQISAKANGFKKAHLQKKGQNIVRQQQLRALQKLQEISGPELKIRWDRRNETPIFIDNIKSTASFKVTPGLNRDEILTANARLFFAENAALLRIDDPENEFKLTGISGDALGKTHLRYQQVFDGLEIRGRDVIVHIGTDGRVESFSGRFIPSLKFFSTREKISADEALNRALSDFKRQADDHSPEKMIYPEGKNARLVWHIRLKKGIGTDISYFIDALTGELVKKMNNIKYEGPADGSGTDVQNQTRNLKVYQIGSDYYMIDTSKPMYDAAASTLPQDGRGVIYTLDARNADSTLYFVSSNDRNSWNNKPAVSAAANGALVFDYYKQVHNRNAIDDKGTSMNVVVNFKENFNNAFWNGSLMVFGNGDGVQFSDLTGSLDVTAHEMTHGVIENTANLIYEEQPGALNESFADVFGVLFEFWVKGDQGNWLLGEDVTTPNIPNDCLRNMADPGAANVANQGQQPAHMSAFQVLPNTPEGDNGGVHINSGIPNKAFYLFAQSTSLANAEKVYYLALSKYLTRNAQFVDTRIAVIKASEELFGAGSAQATAAAQAFDAVGITDGQATPPPADNPAVIGTEYLAVTSVNDGLLYRVPLDISEFLPISFSTLKRRPTAEDDGGFVYYVDNNFNIHIAATDGSSDQVLTDTGVWDNISVSPNGRFLAATSIYAEAAVYIFDFADATGNSDKRIELFTPTYTKGEKAGTILYPDRIDWSSDSDYLMYDALNAFVSSFGDTTQYWDINIIRPTDMTTVRIFPPQPPGVNIGNPVFASNSDNKIVFDYIDADNQVSVLAANLNTGAIGVVTNNFNSLGNPSFSNDDKRVFYHYMDNNGSSIWSVDLLQDGLTGDGNDIEIIAGGMNALDFTVGQRPTEVEEQPTTVPEDFTLLQNYPNPFNPSTVIGFSLPQRAQVSVKIFDMLGREVTTLTQTVLAAGSHEVLWNGRDQAGNILPSALYFYKLTAQTGQGMKFTQTRKMTLLK